MKMQRKLIPAIAMLLVSATMLSSASFAWFSMNQKASATGMKVKATASSSLVIGKTCKVGTDITVDFTDVQNVELNPITFDSSSGNVYKYNSNPADIDAKTGLALSDKSVTLAPVSSVAQDGAKYYQDYVVYLASAGSEKTNQVLTADITFDAGGQAIVDTLKALTVDFYIPSAPVAEDLVHGKLSGPAGYAHSVNHSTTCNASTASGTSLKLEGQQLKTGVTIPLNTTDNGLPVVMRVYFDGALESSIGQQAYVNTQKAVFKDITISVDFHVADGA